MLAGTIGLAMLILIAGVGLASRVRREHRLAEQRVSFVNRVSHELRTPLTNILLNLDVAADDLEENAEPARRLGLAREEARRLGRLIENVLTFSRKERDAVELSPKACAPAAVIQEILDQFGPAFRRREIVMEAALDHSRACFLDADALAQIAANLFSNVEKYVPAGSVQLQLRLEQEELILTVSDRGPGIPADAVDRIFLPFERLNDRTTAGVTGTGLGLAIARELAGKLGGTLKLLPSSVGAIFELRVHAPPVPDLRATSAA
jgi:signal transduction histidine kinase